MKGKRIIAGLLVMIYLGMMHPMIAYGDTDGGGVPAIGLPGVSGYVREETSLLVSAQEGGVLRLGSVELEIPGGALREDTDIRISRLVVTEDTGETLSNVTEGGGGYRFEPAGTQFQKEVTVRMGYDQRLTGNAGALENLYTYYYDTKRSEWERLERVKVDEEGCVIESVTTHFTDMINGTLTLPEGPSPLNFNLNSIKSLEAANPGSGVLGLKGLEGNGMGSAGFRFDLAVPGGRNGMAGRVSVVYSSESRSGVMGRGFDVEYGSRISIDTRWGLPKYDGKDTYLLDGVILKPDGREEGGERYTPLREGGYERIIRKARVGGGYYWEVTNRLGMTKTYGKDTESWKGPGNVKQYEWYVEQEEDVYGNYVSYGYEKEGGEIYIKEIRWTGNERLGDEGRYWVRFGYDEDGRDDIRVDGRGKFVSEMRKLLMDITVGYQGDTIRRYLMRYGEDYAGMTQLETFGEEDPKVPGEYWWSYGFKYVEPEKDGNGNYIFFEDKKAWTLDHGLSTQQGLSGGAEGSVSGGLGVGLMFADVRMTGGGRFSSSSGESKSEVTLVDMNGDGRPDSVWVEGNVLMVGINNGNGFDSGEAWLVNEGSIPTLEKEENSNFSAGGQVYGGAGVLSGLYGFGANYGKTWQDGSSSAESGFVDVDGDGLVDFVEAGATSYLRNTGSSFDRVWYLSDGGTPAEQEEVIEDPDRVKEYEDRYYQQAPIRAWRAPLSGIVKVKQKIRAVSDEVSSDGVEAKLYEGAKTEPSERYELTEGNHRVDSGWKEYEMARSGALYFVMDPKADTRGDDVEWNIVIDYERVKYFEGLDREVKYWWWAETLSADAFRGSLDGRGTLRPLYDPVHGYDAQDQWVLIGYKRASGNWESLVRRYYWTNIEEEVGVVWDLLVKGGYFIPGRVSVEGFSWLMGKAGSEESKKALSTYYAYDAATQEYVINETNKGKMSQEYWEELEEEVQRVVSKCPTDQKEVLAGYRWTDGSLVRSKNDGTGVNYYREGISKDLGARQRGNPGNWTKDGSHLVLDTIDGKVWTLDLGSGTVYREGEIIGEATVQDDGTLTIKIVHKNGGSVSYVQGYRFEGYVGVAEKVTREELEVAWEGESAGSEYHIEDAVWLSIAGERLAALISVCDGVGEAGFIESLYTEDIGTGQYELRLVSAEEEAKANAILYRLGWKEQVEEVGGLLGQYYETSISEAGMYELRSVWKQNIPTGLKALAKKYGWTHWGTVVRSIRYYAKGLYEVTGGTIDILELGEEGFWTRIIDLSEVGLVWDSAGEGNFSVKDLSESPVTYETMEFVDNETEVVGKHGPESRDVLFGGVKQWFYGIWLGNQAAGRNPFSEGALYAQRNAAVTKDPDDIKKDANNTKENPAGSKADETPPKYLSARVRGLIPIAQGGGEEYEIESEQETGITVTDEVLIGNVTIMAKSVFDNAAPSGVRSWVERYSPIIAGDFLHANRIGGGSYYEVMGLGGLEGKKSSGGDGTRMVSLRSSRSEGKDTFKGVTVSVNIPVGDGKLEALEDFKKAAEDRSKGSPIDEILGGSFGLTASDNTSDAEMYQMVQDFNGDGIADIVQYSGGNILVTAGSPDGFKKVQNLSGGKLFSKSHTEYPSKLSPCFSNEDRD